MGETRLIFSSSIGEAHKFSTKVATYQTTRDVDILRLTD